MTKASFRLGTAMLAALLAGCRAEPPAYFPGYVEADYVRLASPIAGTLARSYVERGTHVQRGARAFVLEQDNERAARLEAEARQRRAAATLADLRKGSRPAELAVVESQLAQAQAALRLSQADLARESKLVAQNFVSPARIDELKAAVKRDEGRVREAASQLQVSRLGARSDALRAAEQDVQAAEAQAAQAQWRLDQKTMTIPADAEVADVLYRPGELVPAGTPVVTLLVQDYVRARFFVPQTGIGALRLGQQVSLRCDGCAGPVAANISFISRDAEYTAPIIYSQETRANLVFMVEAKPYGPGAAALHPGQPLEVRLVQNVPQAQR
ncbi:HlyD family efflux transporter periplasmic adaptor subunit [Massilia arenosa]|uniref:HlyD family efflux transporter periplasmic adaptor subunit n=1 Tax=Zemynaea arenosa TaxID=2561931 RepID=A0A4Y9S9J4_9BURK|nr:HlyD family efflux transporter periplasmic adaptor subunit [Massilia arenosa]TFW16237.1 HlyD family efflux transporter periplasmic adaptor subunit [Massilia arenosa]